MPLPRKGGPAPTSAPIAHERCWAKTTADGQPGINVRDHCLNVGYVAQAIIQAMPVHLRNRLPQGAATLAALHDIGKVSPGFQAKCEAWLVRENLKDTALREGWAVPMLDHAKISQHMVQQMLRASQLYAWAAAIGAHHGKIQGERVQVREPWEDERRRLAEELIAEFGPIPNEAPDDATLWFTAGLITLADWIGSNEDLFPQDVRCDSAGRQAQARKTLLAIGWGSATLRPRLSFGDLFPKYSANALQAAAVRTIREPGVYVIEGPMGCGKTEAALDAAYQVMTSGKADGIYFALPTQVTSNRIHLRAREFLERAAADSVELRLAHSASWLVDSSPPPSLHPAGPDGEAREHVRTGRSWFSSPKRALLARFGVGTLDQALLGVVAARHFFLRQFGLAGKVVILDEVHSYDLYTGTLIDALVRRLRELECTVIVLSATLTRERRRQLLQAGADQPLSDAYPLISVMASPTIEVSCDPDQDKSVRVSFRESSVLIEQAMVRAESGECVLWIRNTVDEAQDTWRRLKGAGREGGPPVALLHSRFPFFRREQLEAHWMEVLGKNSPNRPTGCVLVSTQIAEQSVDIDADLLITDLAPTDMLLQRLGRLWRHDRPSRRGCPEVWIQNVPLSDETLRSAPVVELRATLGKSARIYAPYVLLRSLREWRPRSAVALPGDVRAILEATYAPPDSDEPESWRTLREELEENRRKLEAHALSATRVWTMPALEDEEGVQTRWSTYPTARLLLATEVTSHDAHSAQLRLMDGATVSVRDRDRDWDFAAAKAIHRNLAPVPRWAVATALRLTPGWISNYVAQPTAVGRVLPDGRVRWPASDRETGLWYNENEGVIIRRESVPRVAEEETDESCD